MSPMPAGWSVDVNGTRVVVRVSGRPDDEFDLSAEEARSLKNQLHVAYLIARRTRLAAGDPEQLSTEMQRDIEAHKSFGSRQPISDLASDLSPMPAGWRVQAVGRSVHFEVPASGADGVFQLAHTEALVAGIALIRGSERARVLRFSHLGCVRLL